MSEGAALRVALELLHMPSRVRSLRAHPLPADVLSLLKIAAGDETAVNDAAQLFDRSHDVVRNAAAFFIEQILFFPEADSYRVLGAARGASPAELRRNMALLMRWLHPDVDANGARLMLAARVTKAWETLKTPDRRAAYDRAQAASKRKTSGQKARAMRPKREETRTQVTTRYD